jgi:hypothetical protein
MDISVKASVTKLNKRAAALNGLVDKKSHPQVGRSLQQAFGGLITSATILGELEHAGLAYIDRKIRKAKTQKDQDAARQDALGCTRRLDLRLVCHKNAD